MELRKFHMVLVALLAVMLFSFIAGQMFRSIAGLALIIVITAILIQIFTRENE